MSWKAAIATRNGIGVDARRSPERRLESLALRVRKQIDGAEDGEEELMQPGEAELGLGFHPGRGEHGGTHCERVLAHVTEQCRLADAGFSADHQRASTFMQVMHEGVQALQICVTPDQRLRLVDHRLSIVTGCMARLPTPSCVISVPPSAALVGWTADATRDGSSQPFRLFADQSRIANMSLVS